VTYVVVPVAFIFLYFIQNLKTFSMELVRALSGSRSGRGQVELRSGRVEIGLWLGFGLNHVGNGLGSDRVKTRSGRDRVGQDWV
jgi:hypothetical protein